MRHKISTIISYCTNDFRFIGRGVAEAKKFSSEIVIPVCDHFFDGSPERVDLLEETYRRHPDCKFIEFAYNPERIYSPYHHPDKDDWAIFWAATARYIGYHFADPSNEYVLFLDSDEIADGNRFLEWLETENYREYDAVRHGAYLYALSADYRSRKAANTTLFVKRSTLGPLTLINDLERLGCFLSHPGTKIDKELGLDGKPLFHHYSWVRTKPECLRKTGTWGHRNDADWNALVEETFAGKKIFALPDDFERVQEVFFDPFSVEIPEKGEGGGKVLRIGEKELFRKEIELEL